MKPENNLPTVEWNKIQENRIERVVCKIVSILFQFQSVFQELIYI